MCGTRRANQLGLIKIGGSTATITVSCFKQLFLGVLGKCPNLGVTPVMLVVAQVSSHFLCAFLLL